MMSHAWSGSYALALVLLLGWSDIVQPGDVQADCSVEATGVGTESALIIHLSPGCTPAEQEARAIASAAIMEAVAKGRVVDLMGVTVQGDLIFDRLAVQMPQSGIGERPNEQGGTNQPHVEEQRLVRQAVIIRNSILSGAMRHRSVKGTLQFEGAVDFRGTVFKEGVDLSRSVFLRSVTLSGATFEKEAYFVQGQFAQALECRETRFGPHTRFHRSVFRGPVDCAGALFDGLAELLEVHFDQTATFERVRFGSGTGFSGSRFKQRTRFDDAIFSRDAFFGFGLFEGETSFAGAQFLGNADFSEAEFTKPDDLARARFDHPPLFARTKRAVHDPPSELAASPTVQYGLTVLCLVAAAVLVGYALKLR
jgi:hypothetical protein